MDRDGVIRVIEASTRKDHGHAMSLARGACQDAVNRGWIPTHRLDGIEVQRSHDKREIIPATHAQLDHIASALGERGLAVWIMHGLGLRIGECLGLRGLDFRDGFRTVRVQRKAENGKRHR